MDNFHFFRNKSYQFYDKKDQIINYASDKKQFEQALSSKKLYTKCKRQNKEIDKDMSCYLGQFPEKGVICNSFFNSSKMYTKFGGEIKQKYGFNIRKENKKYLETVEKCKLYIEW